MGVGRSRKCGDCAEKMQSARSRRHLKQRWRCKRAADDRYQCRRGVENITSGEAEKSVSRIDQPVLAAVVCGEALAMRRAVVLDREPSIGIVEVGACQEDTEFIAKGDLAPRTWQSSVNQQES